MTYLHYGNRETKNSVHLSFEVKLVTWKMAFPELMGNYGLDIKGVMTAQLTRKLCASLILLEKNHV